MFNCGDAVYKARVGLGYEPPCHEFVKKADTGWRAPVPDIRGVPREFCGQQ
jgi:hypothetical protein